MDQQKIQRLLRLLMLLSGQKRYSLQELISRMEISERTIYRYLESFETAGFIVERNNGNYWLQQAHSATRTLQNLMHFTEEELLILYDTLSLIEGTSAIKEQLIRKLNMLYDYKVLQSFQPADDLLKIQSIAQALRQKRQVLFKSYRSSNSNIISDRKVEPFDFTADYRSVWCYEHQSRQCKQFKLARIQSIAILPDTWEKEEKHHIHFTDAFRISAKKPVGKVAVRLSLKAYNLLVEEFPLTAKYIDKEKNTYLLSIPVAGFQGIGRFVLGLPGEIEVLGRKEFKEFLSKERKKYID